jgi:dTDP-4-dehydrorhamnose 3,5-epimerase-like enzyme
MLDVRGIRQVVIPTGVWHLIANIGAVDAELINLPTQPYHREKPDRRGLPWDTDKIPLDVRSLLPATWPR